MKYLMVEVMERAISTPEVFDSHQDAQERMCEYVAQVLDESVETIQASYQTGKSLNDYTEIKEFEAYTERHGNNFDWKIFKIHDSGHITE